MSRRAAYTAIILFGLVSLLGDVVYEGARGVVPAYLEYLGASALVVGVVGGLGEFLGYAFRLVGGYLADTTRAYWLFMFLGYGMLLAIPLLAAASSWQVAAALVLAERVAKGLRAPARDTLLSTVGGEVGVGKAFGLHELLDQVGAMAGPALVSALLYLGGYRQAFSFLLAPYLLLMAILVYTHTRLSGRGLEPGRAGRGGAVWLDRRFLLYSLAVLANTAGLIHVSLILYRFSSYVEDWQVAVFYLAIMGVDAVAAPVSGLLYDRVGPGVLLAPFILSLAPSILGVAGGLGGVVAAGMLLGMVMGMQESVYRAAVADLSPPGSRGMAYGVFNTLYGVGFLLSGAVFGLAIERGYVVQAVGYSVALQALAVTLLARSASRRIMI